MPRATINRDELIHFDLKSCPGGYVKLRRLSFHEMTQRQDLAGKMIYEQRQQLNRAQRRQAAQGGEDQLVRSMLEMANVAVMEFEFKNCVADHNLEDENGVTLDFSNSLALKNLDPKIGAEIGRRIDELNQEDEDEVVSPLGSAPTTSSPDGQIEPETTTG